jgi:hypothetical protein
MAEPRIICDNFPNSLIYTSEMFNSNLIDNSADGSNYKFKIVIHIRQGELALSQFRDRLLPLSHYERILQILVPILKENQINFRITIPKEDGQLVQQQPNPETST